MSYRRLHVPLLQQLLARPVEHRGGLCHLCGRPLDYEGVEETVGPTTVRVRGKHHGAEEVVTFELGTRAWEGDDLERAVRGWRWFEPKEQGESR